jgi:hypothetical protein
MAAKKRKLSPRKPDLTFEVDSFVKFTDKVPDGATTTCAEGVVTSYDPAVAALAERLRGQATSPKRTRHSANGHGQPQKTERQHLEDLQVRLTDCLNAAQSIEARPMAKIIKLLTEARERAIRLRG